jgi:hypothetical protein
MFTRENFSALNKQLFKLVIIIFFLFLASNAFSEDWYFSNAAGMVLEKTFSRAALREPYALKIEHHQTNQIPSAISEYIDPEIIVPESFSAEFHTLYENGIEKNQRWILRYSNGNTWLVISIGETDSEGFAEYYDELKLLIQEDTFYEKRILSSKYFYRDEILMRSEIWQSTKMIDAEISAGDEIGEDVSRQSPETKIHLWSDEYRYARTGALRSIVRTFFADEGEETISLSTFAPLSPESEKISVIKSAPVLSSNFISDIINLPNVNVEYITDDQGRIISEMYTDAEGKKIGEFIHSWSAFGGDRLASISWNGENDTRRIEYEYDDQGNRTIERNYRGGIMERLVRVEEDKEVEELYLQGILHLRAVWKDGQKVSEEYFRQNSGKMPGRMP